MINLMPADAKEQVRFARYNRQAVRYLKLLVGMILVLGAIFGVTIWYLGDQAALVSADVAAKEREIAATAAFRKEATDVSQRLTAIKQIQASQTKFSLLLADLAKALPQGVAIDSIILTGEDAKPVRITVTGTTYNSILAFRQSMAASPRIAGVDLESINQDDAGFHSGVVIGFKPGQAK